LHEDRKTSFAPCEEVVRIRLLLPPAEAQTSFALSLLEWGRIVTDSGRSGPSTDEVDLQSRSGH
jgi:hypothetical protein